MAKKIITKEVDEADVIPTSIAKLPVDYGREDLNNMAKTINEIIDRIS